MTTVPDAAIQMIVNALPGAYLWDYSTSDNPPMADLVVFDSIVPPIPPLRYVVIYPDTGSLTALAVCQQSDTAAFRWQVTSVAPDGAQTRWLATRARDGIVDRRPVADGWTLGTIRHDGGRFLGRDEQVQERAAVVAVDRFHVLAARI